jgi:hypothetical protein
VELYGPAGNDVVHLLAELIENATAWSPSTSATTTSPTAPS